MRSSSPVVGEMDSHADAACGVRASHAPCDDDPLHTHWALDGFPEEQKVEKAGGVALICSS